MVARAFPGLGLKGGYAEGEDGWGDDQNANLIRLSALCQGGVLGRIAAVPAAPAQGDVYILTAAPNTQSVALYDNAAWVYLAPAEGWLLYDKGADTFVMFDGVAWKVLQTGGASFPAFAGNKGKVLAVKTDESGVEWVVPASSGGSGNGSTLIGLTALTLPADFVVGTGAWRTPATWAVARDTFNSWSAANGNIVVPPGAKLARVTIYTAWTGVPQGYVRVFDSAAGSTTTYAGDIRTGINETLSTLTGPLVPCTPGNTIVAQYNSGSGNGTLAGLSGTNFARPCRLQVEWFSDWPA